MTVIPGLVRRAAAEAERQLREGMGLLARLGRDLERSAELGRLLPSYTERLAGLEQAVRDQDAELRTLRTELDSLVGQLNDRVLPRIDERMDDAERDLAAVATSLIRTGRDTAGHRTRLEAAERRLADLRTRLAQLEQRTGLWRDLQANMARLGDDLDAMRARMALRAAEPPADFAAASACDVDAFGRFCRALLDRGVYPPPSQFEAWFPSLAHDDEAVEQTVAAAVEAFEEALG